MYAYKIAFYNYKIGKFILHLLLAQISYMVYTYKRILINPENLVFANFS